MKKKNNTLSIRLTNNELTPCPDESVELTLPDFPEINCNTFQLPQGLAELRESLREELGTCFYPPAPTQVSIIPCESGQFVLQLSVGM